MAKIRVRITGYQRVFYSQVVEMDERTFRKADRSDGEGIDAIVGPLIDPTNVCSAEDIEDCDVSREPDRPLPAEQPREGGNGD